MIEFVINEYSVINSFLRLIALHIQSKVYRIIIVNFLTKNQGWDQLAIGYLLQLQVPRGAISESHTSSGKSVKGSFSYF